VRRVPLTTVVREEIDQLLSQGLEQEANLLSELAEVGRRYLAGCAGALATSASIWDSSEGEDTCTGSFNCFFSLIPN